ncbi:MAG: hypothetical protein ACI3Z8_08950 [Paludibacteraceae bacterium]
MKRLSSLIATLIVALVAFAQTPSVTIELTDSSFVVTPNPITECVFYVAQATADYNFSETVTPQTYMQNFVTTMDDFKFSSLNTPGAKTIEFVNCGNLTEDGSNTILAVTVSVIGGVRTLTSDVVRVDTVFTKSAEGGDTPEEPVVPEEPVLTIEPGKYYISTFVDEDTYLASTGSGKNFNLGATLFDGVTKPTAIHEFEFESVAGKQAVFYIKDNGGNYLNTSTRYSYLSSSATADETAEWKVEVLDEEEGNVRISHVLTAKMIHFEAYTDPENGNVTKWYVCNRPDKDLTTAEQPILLPVIEDEPVKASITMTIEKGQVILTPTPADAHVLCYGLDVEFFEYGTDSLAISTYVDEDLDFMYESAADIDDLCPAGAQTICISDWMTGEYPPMRTGSRSIILAAVVAWDDEIGAAVRLSDVVFVDTTFASVPTCGADDEPVKTIEAGQYYISSTLVGGTDEYLLSTTATTNAKSLTATLFVNENTLAAAHKFDFIAVDGQEACFNIKDANGKFLYLNTPRGSISPVFCISATLPETGATWRVELKDEENHAAITNTENSGDLHCMKVAGTIAYFFGTESELDYNLPVITKVKGASTDSRETIINRQVRKTIENGQLILSIDGVRYNILGMSLSN